MANLLKIIISGKQQSGKSSLAKMILAEYVNKKIGKKRFVLDKSNKEIYLVDTYNNNKPLLVDYPSKEVDELYKTYSVKLYSFLDPLKRLCIEMLGLDPMQCYGSDDDMGSPTHMCWEDIFDEVRKKYSRPRRGSGGKKPASGKMTAEEVVRVVGEDFLSKMDGNYLARGLYSLINSEGYNLAIVHDAYYPNEVTLGTENGAKVIRLLRSNNVDDTEQNAALDEFPLGEFTMVLDNNNLSMTETHHRMRPIIYNWFSQAKI
jgi:hypothetical protein